MEVGPVMTLKLFLAPAAGAAVGYALSLVTQSTGNT